MKIFVTLRDAISGWNCILRGDRLWADHFRLTPAGLITALVLFYALAFIVQVLASMLFGVPTLEGFIDIMVVRTLWLMSLMAALVGTRFALRDKGPVLPILVPGIYALIFYLVLGTIVSVTLGMLLPLLWLGLAYMLFRLGRVVGQWTFGVAAAFALLTTLLLVGLPMTLYMLVAPATLG